jgi:hypothetical protein
VPTSSALSLQAPSIVPVSTPTSPVTKDTFKHTKCDKAAGKDVYTFAENFYKVTKRKSNKIINNALVSLCSGNHKLGKFLAAHSSGSPAAQLNGTSEEWTQFPLLCNMRSQFLTLTSHIFAVKDAMVSKEINANMFRRAPQVWVHNIWERLRSIRVEDVGHSDEQFVWIFQHILPKLHPRFSAQNFKNNFQS